MIKAVIIDESKEHIYYLHIQLKKYCPEIYVISDATTMDEGINMIESYNPDLVFLGTDLGDTTGFHLLETISNPAFGVVFLANDGRYAADAFNYNTIHYLIKPVVGEKLITVVERFHQIFNKTMSFPEES